MERMTLYYNIMLTMKITFYSSPFKTVKVSLLNHDDSLVVFVVVRAKDFYAVLRRNLANAARLFLTGGINHQIQPTHLGVSDYTSVHFLTTPYLSAALCCLAQHYTGVETTKELELDEEEWQCLVDNRVQLMEAMTLFFGSFQEDGENTVSSTVDDGRVFFLFFIINMNMRIFISFTLFGVMRTGCNVSMSLLPAFFPKKNRADGQRYRVGRDGAERAANSSRACASLFRLYGFLVLCANGSVD